MIKFNYNNTITPDLIKKAEQRYPNQDIMIVIENTKYQSPEKLEEIATLYKNKKIIISVTGGLNPKKEKFNDEYYQRRTYHSPLELSKIIRFFQKIERRIKMDWSELEKAMYIYATICNSMNYDENEINGVDMARSLSGVLYGKAVCSGFALILKEAFDRVGIECVYQNMESYHSWNVAKINGKYRALDLTWDCYKKGKNGCQFIHFGREEDFYKDTAHSVKYQKEEHEYPISVFTTEELNAAVDKINASGFTILPLDQNREVNIKGVGRLLNIYNGNIYVLNSRVKKFVRKDGTEFYIVAVGSYKNLRKFFFFEAGQNKFRGTVIYSESPLDQLPSEYDYDIANGLLSNERVKRKINNYNGYVGYIGSNRAIYYDSDIEREELNIIR